MGVGGPPSVGFREWFQFHCISQFHAAVTHQDSSSKFMRYKCLILDLD